MMSLKGSVASQVFLIGIVHLSTMTAFGLLGCYSTVPSKIPSTQPAVSTPATTQSVISRPATLSDAERKKVDSEIWEDFAWNPDALVPVLVSLWQEDDASIREIEDRVLSKISDAEFQKPVLLKSVAMVMGQASSTAIETLARQPEVMHIHKSRTVHRND